MLGNALTPVVKNLLIINVLLYIVCIFINEQNGIDLNNVLGLHYINSPLFEPYQAFTHMFLHAYKDPLGGIVLMHILGNMFALFMFGPALENVWGPKRFLLYYMICGIGAALLHSVVTYLEMKPMETAMNTFMAAPTPDNFLIFIKKTGIKVDNLYTYADQIANPAFHGHAKKEVSEIYTLISNQPTVGASGAIFGILLGYGMLFPNTVLMLLFPPIPIKAKYFVILYGLLELYLGTQASQNDNVAHFAHIGGMIFGFIIIVYWSRKRDRFY